MANANIDDKLMSTKIIVINTIAHAILVLGGCYYFAMQIRARFPKKKTFSDIGAEAALRYSALFTEDFNYAIYDSVAEKYNVYNYNIATGAIKLIKSETFSVKDYHYSIPKQMFVKKAAAPFYEDSQLTADNDKEAVQLHGLNYDNKLKHFTMGTRGDGICTTDATKNEETTIKNYKKYYHIPNTDGDLKDSNTVIPNVYFECNASRTGRGLLKRCIADEYFEHGRCKKRKADKEKYENKIHHDEIGRIGEDPCKGKLDGTYYDFLLDFDLIEDLRVVGEYTCVNSNLGSLVLCNKSIVMESINLPDNLAITIHYPMERFDKLTRACVKTRHEDLSPIKLSILHVPYLAMMDTFYLEFDKISGKPKLTQYPNEIAKLKYYAKLDGTFFENVNGVYVHKVPTERTILYGNNEYIMNVPDELIHGLPSPFAPGVELSHVTRVVWNDEKTACFTMLGNVILDATVYDDSVTRDKDDDVRYKVFMDDKDFIIEPSLFEFVKQKQSYKYKYFSTADLYINDQITTKYATITASAANTMSIKDKNLEFEKMLHVMGLERDKLQQFTDGTLKLDMADLEAMKRKVMDAYARMLQMHQPSDLETADYGNLLLDINAKMANLQTVQANRLDNFINFKIDIPDDTWTTATAERQSRLLIKYYTDAMGLFTNPDDAKELYDELLSKCKKVEDLVQLRAIMNNVDDITPETALAERETLRKAWNSLNYITMFDLPGFGLQSDVDTHLRKSTALERLINAPFDAISQYRVPTNMTQAHIDDFERTFKDATKQNPIPTPIMINAYDKKMSEFREQALLDIESVNVDPVTSTIESLKDDMKKMKDIWNMIETKLKPYTADDEDRYLQQYDLHEQYLHGLEDIVYQDALGSKTLEELDEGWKKANIIRPPTSNEKYAYFHSQYIFAEIAQKVKEITEMDESDAALGLLSIAELDKNIQQMEDSRAGLASRQDMITIADEKLDKMKKFRIAANNKLMSHYDNFSNFIVNSSPDVTVSEAQSQLDKFSKIWDEANLLGGQPNAAATAIYTQKFNEMQQILANAKLDAKNAHTALDAFNFTDSDKNTASIDRLEKNISSIINDLTTDADRTKAKNILAQLQVEKDYLKLLNTTIDESQDGIDAVDAEFKRLSALRKHTSDELKTINLLKLGVKTNMDYEKVLSTQFTPSANIQADKDAFDTEFKRLQKILLPTTAQINKYSGLMSIAKQFLNTHNGYVRLANKPIAHTTLKDLQDDFTKYTSDFDLYKKVYNPHTVEAKKISDKIIEYKAKINQLAYEQVVSLVAPIQTLTTIKMFNDEVSSLKQRWALAQTHGKPTAAQLKLYEDKLKELEDYKINIVYKNVIEFVVDENVKTVSDAKANIKREKELWDTAIAIQPPSAAETLKHNNNIKKMNDILDNLGKAYGSIFTFNTEKTKNTVKAANEYIKELDRKYNDGKKIRPADANEESTYQAKRKILLEKVIIQETAFDKISAFDVTQRFKTLKEHQDLLTKFEALRTQMLLIHQETHDENAVYNQKHKFITDKIDAFKAAYKHVNTFDPNQNFKTEADATAALVAFEDKNKSAASIRSMDKNESDMSAKKISEIKKIIIKLKTAYVIMMAIKFKPSSTIDQITDNIKTFDDAYKSGKNIRQPLKAEQDHYDQLRSSLMTTKAALEAKRLYHANSIKNAKFSFTSLAKAKDALKILEKHWTDLNSVDSTSQMEKSDFHQQETNAKNEIRRLQIEEIVNYNLQWTGVDVYAQNIHIINLINDLGKPIPSSVTAVQVTASKIVDSDKTYKSLLAFPITVISFLPQYKTQENDFKKLLADALASGRPPTQAEQAAITKLKHNLNMSMRPTTAALQRLFQTIHGGIIIRRDKVGPHLDILDVEGLFRIVYVFHSVLEDYKKTQGADQFVVEQFDKINVDQLKYVEEVYLNQLKNLNKSSDPVEEYDNIESYCKKLNITIPNIASYKP